MATPCRSPRTLFCHPRLKLSPRSGDPAAANPSQAGGKLPITLHPRVRLSQSLSILANSQPLTQALARGVTLLPSSLSLLGTMLPSALVRFFLHGGAAEVTSRRGAGSATCVCRVPPSSQRRGMGPACLSSGFWGRPDRNFRVWRIAAEGLSVAVILPMGVVPRHLAHAK